MELYGQLCRKEILLEAWEKVRRKNAKGGADGINPEDLDEKIHKVLNQLSKSLSNENYAPAPYQQAKIPKFNEANEWRGLSLPVVVDKIVQQAFVNLVGPVFEKDFLDCSYAYRPGKGPVRAIKRLDHILKTQKPRWTISFDIDDFFDNLNHERLLREFSKKIHDERLSRLIRLWLEAGYVNRKGDFTDLNEGIAQGSVVSPLLSNIYLHALDMRAVEKKRSYVRYSDNFIALLYDKQKAYVFHEEITGFLQEKLMLKLNENPNPYQHVNAGFTFLGIFFKENERKISRQKKTKIFKKLNWLTNPYSTDDPEKILRRLNESVLGHKRFYGYIKPDRQFAAFDEHLIKRIREFIPTFGKKGAFASKTAIMDFVLRIEFYRERDPKEKKAFAKKLGSDIYSKVVRAKTAKQTANGEEKGEKSGAHKKSGPAGKNRLLRKIADEAEVVVTRPGIFIGKTSRRLVLKEARKIIHEHPFANIRQITIATKGVSLSSDMVVSCADNKIPLAFLNPWGRVHAVLQSPLHAMGELSFLQIRMYETERAVVMSRKILTGKCRNQMNLLKYYSRHRSKSDPGFFSEVKEKLKRMEKDLKEIQRQNLDKDSKFSAVRTRLFTAEARVSASYWSIIKILLPVELGFGKREKRGARDVVNSMLNYGYGILYQRVWQALLMVGLNPQISFLHAFQDHKPAFVYDVIEEFRQALVDRPLFSLMTKGSRYKRLKVDTATGLLDDFTKRTTQKAVLNRLATLIGFRGKKVQAGEIVKLQAKDIAEFIKGKKKSYRPFISTY